MPNTHSVIKRYPTMGTNVLTYIDSKSDPTEFTHRNLLHSGCLVRRV